MSKFGHGEFKVDPGELKKIVDEIAIENESGELVMPMRFVTQRNGEHRVIPLSSEAHDAIVLWLAAHQRQMLNGRAQKLTTRATGCVEESPKQSEVAKPAPPIAAQFLLRVLIPPTKREGLAQWIDEYFDRDVARFGVKRAKILVWAHVLRALTPLLGTALARLGIWSLVATAFKKLIGG